MTVGDPGDHGTVVTGTQGWGVSTPLAAEVAAATWGFERVLHIPKAMMFDIGILSITVAAGMELAMTRFMGCTFIVLGATPKLHMSIPPLTTSCAIIRLPNARISWPNSN
ncbi:MAG: hypothetical protein H6Q38_3061 [Chloroflexi bacterium]|nr:hypothetical protein [Chloroflexota bacterium]